MLPPDNFNTADFVLAFRTSCKSHKFDRVEEKGLRYLGLEDNSKGYIWTITILYQQLSKKEWSLPGRTAGPLSDCKQLSSKILVI